LKNDKTDSSQPSSAKKIPERKLDIDYDVEDNQGLASFTDESSNVHKPLLNQV
jgi:hypothetical protein